MQRDKMRTLTLTALFTALVFVGTYVVKIPLPFGYTHIGDSMIFLAVMVLGWKRGAAAGAVGAALADLIGGFAVWVAPTLIAKAAMATTLGLVLDRRPFGLRGRALWLTGAAISAIVHAALYTLATALIYGGPAAITMLPAELMQSAVGMAVAFVLAEALQKTALAGSFAYTTHGKEPRA